MFTAVPTYDRFRVLRRRPGAKPAEDVFALQCALIAFLHVDIKADGVFGPRTHALVRKAQAALDVKVDGLVGTKTWAGVMLALARPVELNFELPVGSLHGQLEHESGLRGGMFSWLIRVAQRRADHPNPELVARTGRAFDAGAAQLNSDLYSLVDAFDPQYAIHLCGAHMRDFFNRFAGVKSRRRRWSLAQGAWNAPAFASYIAREEGARVAARDTSRPSKAARELLEEYMDDVGVYVA